ncbi:hypothetical protein JCM17478_04420 [Thermopirellula anaerolimosa]
MLERVTVVIPAYNEEKSLPLVLEALPQVGRVIVVNNASSDNTAAVAASHGATVVDEPRRGYGSACMRGLTAVQESIEAGQQPPSVVVFLDADYSDHPELLPDLVMPILHGTADFVLGSRLQGLREPGAMPIVSVLGNRLACFLMQLLFKARYTDLGPFRAMDYTALSRLGMSDRSFGWTIEMQIKAVRAGLRILERDITESCGRGGVERGGVLGEKGVSEASFFPGAHHHARSYCIDDYVARGEAFLGRDSSPGSPATASPDH